MKENSATPAAIAEEFCVEPGTPAYAAKKAELLREGAEALVAVVADHDAVSALFAPTRSPAWVIDVVNGGRGSIESSTPAALAGYPLITVPAGHAFGELPVGVTFMGRRWSEPTLIKIAFAFEQATRVRRPPEFLPTLRLA